MKYTLILTIGRDEDPGLDTETVRFEASDDEAAREALAVIVQAAKMLPGARQPQLTEELIDLLDGMIDDAAFEGETEATLKGIAERHHAGTTTAEDFKHLSDILDGELIA